MGGVEDLARRQNSLRLSASSELAVPVFLHDAASRV